MAEPRFEVGQEVHVAQYHCSVCKKLEFEPQHPVRVMAIEPYGDGFEYRIEDVRGVHYQTKEVLFMQPPIGASRQSVLLLWAGGLRTAD